MENQVTRLKERVAVLSDDNHEDADHICFMHLKDACDDFGASGRVAKKLLDLVEELFAMTTQPNHVLHQPSGSKPIPWYEPGERAREILDQFPDFTFSHLEWESYAFPDGYEIHYITKDNGVLCHNCANKELDRTIDPDDDQFYIVACDVNYEDDQVWCNHCERQIEPAYGED